MQAFGLQNMVADQRVDRLEHGGACHHLIGQRHEPDLDTLLGLAIERLMLFEFLEGDQRQQVGSRPDDTGQGPDEVNTMLANFPNARNG